MKPVLLVTGGSRGIGAATAVLGARKGYTVYLTYNTAADRAAEVVDTITRDGGEAHALACDVAEEADVARIFATLDRDGAPPTALVNNAGIVGREARLEDISSDRWSRIFEVNLFGTVWCCREAVRRMSTRHGGAGGVIVNVSSVAARMGGGGVFLDYAATKGAMDTLTVGLAHEVADEGIRVNAVRPGLIDTDIHADIGTPDRVEQLAHRIPMQRGGTPEEVAASILWLLSDEAAYVTGVVLDVSGGR